MASGERRPRESRNRSTFLRTLGRESLAFSSNESLNPFPLWKRFLWLGILCVLILTCLVGILVLAFSHFQSTDAQTTQIRTGALIGFGFLLAAVLAWTVFVYVKLGCSCPARPRNQRSEEFMALATSSVSTRVGTTIPASRNGRLPSTDMNNPSNAVLTRFETSIERNLAPTVNSTVNNNNRNIPLVSQHEGVRVTSGRFILSHELVPVSRVQIEGPRTLIDDRRTMRRFNEFPTQLPPPYVPISLHQEYIHRGHDIVRNATMLPQYVSTPCREISRIQTETLRTHIDHCRLSSQYLDRALHPPPPYRYQDRTSPPPAYDALSISRRNRIYSDLSNPPSYRSAPSSPVLSRHSDMGRSRYLTTSRSPLLHSEDGSAHNEDRNSFLSSSLLSLPQDGDVFVCETVSSLHRSLSPLAQDVQSESCVLTLRREQSPGVLSLNEDVLHSHGEASNRFLSRSQTSLNLDGELLQQHNDREIFHSDGQSITSPRLVREDVSSGPVIYVYLGQAEQR